jgi:hypothetical protein
MGASKMIVHRKQCTYLAPRFAQSTKGLKQGSTCASSPQNTIGVSKTITEPMWPKPCTYLAPTLTPSPNGPKKDSTLPILPQD